MVGEATKVGKNGGILKPSWAFIETNNINEAGPKIFTLYSNLKKIFLCKFQIYKFEGGLWTAAKNSSGQSAWAVVRLWRPLLMAFLHFFLSSFLIGLLFSSLFNMRFNSQNKYDLYPSFSGCLELKSFPFCINLVLIKTFCTIKTF